MDDPEGFPKTTALAHEIKALKADVERAMSKRSALPQPLFWSLFHSRIADIKKRRAEQRLLDEILGK